ncbi:MAG: MBL fold metallo-hydrolase [Deltaproteobacteria bacterium]|nr:MAG: MBL fold metallo-hydrolase [Deltaproteobacteria bacterium]
MKLVSLGPLGKVTGSCYLLHDEEADIRVLVDCGEHQDGPDPDAKNREPFPFDPRRIHCVVLTHGHLDHCGRIPDLYADGFVGPVYCTRETAEVAKVVLADAARWSERYDPRWVDRIKWRHPDRKLFAKPLVLAKNLLALFHRSAHIVGAVSVEIIKTSPSDPDRERRIVFSGDIGNNTREVAVQPLLGHRMLPSRPADWVVMESTYGDRRRSPEQLDGELRRKRLAALVREGLERGGPVIIPVFAVQRLQDVLYDLHLLVARGELDLDPETLLVDAPMGLKINRIVGKAAQRDFVSSSGKVRLAWLGKGTFRDLGLDPDDTDHIRRLQVRLAAIFTDSPRPQPPHPKDEGVFLRFLPAWRPVPWEERDALVEAGGAKVVVASGGMCEGGPVVSWLAGHLHRPEATVLLSGYCSPCTLGGALQQVGALVPDQRARLSREVLVGDAPFRLRDLRARVESLWGYSAHADQAGLVDWLFPNHNGTVRQAGGRVILTHGNDVARAKLAERLRERSHELGLGEIEVRMPMTDDVALDLESGDEVSAATALGLEPEASPAVITAGDLRILVDAVACLPEMRQLLRDVLDRIEEIEHRL